MGCGESKHDVVAGNTVLHHKKSDTKAKNSKDIETVHETNAKDNIAYSLVPQQPAAENEDNKEVVGGAVVATCDTKDRDENTAKIKDNKEVVGGVVAAVRNAKDKDENAAKNEDNKEVARDTEDRDENAAKNEYNKEVVSGAIMAARDTKDRDENATKNEDNKEVVNGAVAAARDIKERDENAAAKEENGDKQIDEGKEGGDVKKQEESGGRLISNDSLNDYFTPKKNEEGIDGIVFEERSEEPVYYSPHHADGKEDVLNENVKAENAVEEKELVEETKVVKENGEALNEDKENVVKDTEVLKTTIDAKVLSSTLEEKNQNAEEENKNETPTKDENTK